MKLGQLSAKIKRSCSEKSDFSTEAVLHKSECMACVCQNLKSWTKKMAKNTPHNTAPCHPPPPPLLSILHCEYKCSLQPRPRPVILHPRYLQSCQHQEDIFANSLSYISKQTGNIRKETGTGLVSRRSAPGKLKHFRNQEWGHQLFMLFFGAHR